MTIPHWVVPFLSAGDRMDCEEFLARWEQMPELKAAELIDGVVYIPAPGCAAYGLSLGLAAGWAGSYAAHRETCEALVKPTWLMMGSAPQPDVARRLLSSGMSREEGNFLAGAPELVIEICRSSRTYDLGPKLALYRRAGVPEYVAVLLEERRIEWRYLEGGAYRLDSAGESGELSSEVFPGLVLDVAAFWRRDAAAVLAVVR